jgi:hypothetical protein
VRTVTPSGHTGFDRGAVELEHHAPVGPHRLVPGPLEELPAAGVDGRERLPHQHLPVGLPLERPPLHEAEELRSQAAPSELGQDEDVGVVVVVEDPVGGYPAVRRLGDPCVLLEREAGARPVREEVVQLEVRRAELVHVEGDDEVGDRLGVRAVGAPQAKALVH